MLPMLDLSPEIQALRDSGAIPPEEAARLIARERREVFSIHPELRAASWAGAVLIATGAAILLARNFARIGPVTLASGVGLAAAAAYVYAIWRRRASRASLVDEYVLLLGALLLSADLAYIEGEFHLLDHGWPRHLLVLAIVHGLTAYYFDSKTLLSLSLAALAAWMGIEQRVDELFSASVDTALRAYVCSTAIVMWRYGHAHWNARQKFERVFEHFAANLALGGSLVLAIDDTSRMTGVIATLGIAALVTAHAFRTRSEAFAIYAYVYAVIAVLILIADIGHADEWTAGAMAIAFVASIAGLFRLRFEYRRRQT